MPTYHVDTVMRQAIRADNEATAILIAKEIWKPMADDGSLSDLMVFEWDDPIVTHTEEEGTGTD